MDERLEALINEELDGTLAPDGEAELRGRLGNDPEARAYRDRLQDLARTLDGAVAVDPPPGLRETILSAVHERAGVDAPPPAVRARALPGAPVRRWRWSPGLAYAFGAGLAVGCLVFALARTGLPGRGLDENRLRGSMVTGGDAVVDRSVVALAGVEGTVTVSRIAGRMVAEIDLRGDTATVVEIGAGEAAWTVSHAGASMYSVDLGPAESIPAEIRVSVQAGGSSQDRLLSTQGLR